MGDKIAHLKAREEVTEDIPSRRPCFSVLFAFCREEKREKRREKMRKGGEKRGLACVAAYLEDLPDQNGLQKGS